MYQFFKEALKKRGLTLCHLECPGSLGDANQSIASGVRALREIPRVVRWICVNKASVALLVACFTIVTIAVQTRDHVIRAALPPMSQALQFYIWKNKPLQLQIGMYPIITIIFLFLFHQNTHGRC